MGADYVSYLYDDELARIGRFLTYEECARFMMVKTRIYSIFHSRHICRLNAYNLIVPYTQNDGKFFLLTLTMNGTTQEWPMTGETIEQIDQNSNSLMFDRLKRFKTIQVLTIVGSPLLNDSFNKQFKYAHVSVKHLKMNMANDNLACSQTELIKLFKNFEEVTLTWSKESPGGALNDKFIELAVRENVTIHVISTWEGSLEALTDASLVSIRENNNGSTFTLKFSSTMFSVQAIKDLVEAQQLTGKLPGRQHFGLLSSMPYRQKLEAEEWQRELNPEGAAEFGTLRSIPSRTKTSWILAWRDKEELNNVQFEIPVNII